ncbi:MAG TPA: hypothetical protein VGR22_07890 [Thermomicrobiales bacterium]|nr:hypothetical protein [Thermomicrobiales bacterium]
MAGSTAHPTTSRLLRELDVLEHRLRDGEHRIEEARDAGADVSAWEEFWIDLLRTYEATHDRLAAMVATDSRAAA